MAGTRLYMFDDAVARDWQPFALTRPVGELLLGAYTFRARAERRSGLPCTGHVTSAHLRGFDEPDAARVVALSDIPTDAPRIFISSRAVLDAPLSVAHDGTAVLVAGDAVIGCILPAGAANPGDDWILSPRPDVDGGTVRTVAVDARVVAHVWDLIAMNGEQITRDHDEHEGTAAPGALPRCEMIAHRDGMLRLGRNVVIEPNVVLDFTHGPIRIDDGVTVRAFTRLAGPAWIGRDSTLLGGPYEAVSIGPVCRVHGEVEESIVLGWSNKAHDGFLGHAYLGRWVNLGAMTTNSDLKNNYGTIRLWTPQGETDTGLIKLGCLLGDHVKTGIGSLINTGTVVGAGSNIFGTAMPPKYVAPFSWGSGTDLVAYDVEKFLDVAATVMGRRKLELSDAMRGVLRAAWQSTRGNASQ